MLKLEERGHSLVPAEPGLASARPAYCQVPFYHTPHVFLLQECGGAAWPLLQTVYSCRTCGHTVHGSCLINIRRPCVGAFLNRLPGEDEEEGLPKTSLHLIGKWLIRFLHREHFPVDLPRALIGGAAVRVRRVSDELVTQSGQGVCVLQIQLDKLSSSRPGV